MISSRKVLFIFLLIGFLVLAGNGVVRYRALQRCEKLGVDLENWEGWAVWLEEKIRGRPPKQFEVPLSAVFPFNYAREASLDPADVDEHPKNMDRIGKDLRMFGPVERLGLFNAHGHADLFKGMGENSRLIWIYSVDAKEFDDDAASCLTLFQNLRELNCERTVFSGSGFPALPKLEKLKIYEGRADERLFKILLGCPELRTVMVESFQVSPREAEMLKTLPKIESIWVENLTTESEFGWDR